MTNENKKVWCLIEISWDGDELLGVYATEAAAKTAVKEQKHGNGFTRDESLRRFDIEERPVEQ